MLTDMERCGDEAEKIAKVARRLYEADTRYTPAVDLEHIANCVTAMVCDSLASFAREDPLRAAAVLRNGKAGAEEWKASLRPMHTFMFTEPRTFSSSPKLIFISRSSHPLSTQT